MSGKDRREFLHKAGLAGMFSAIAPAAFAQSSGAFTVDPANTSTPEIKPTHSIKFAAIGLDHAHIFGMIARGSTRRRQLVAFHATDPAQIADFSKKFRDVKLASEDEILNDKSIQLVAGAPIPDLRAPLGIRVMKAGKDYLADKPGITSLKQLADVRKAVKETGRKFAIMYSERLEVRSAVYAGELIKQGAIGRVVQTVNLAPHRVNAPSPSRLVLRQGALRRHPLRHRLAPGRSIPLLHQQHEGQGRRRADRQRRVSAVPEVRRLRRHGDGRQRRHRLRARRLVHARWTCRPGATAGCSSSAPRATSSCASTSTSPRDSKGGNHLYIVDKKQARYIDCKNVQLPFGPQFVTRHREPHAGRAGPGAGLASRRARAQGTEDRDASRSSPEDIHRGGS